MLRYSEEFVKITSGYVSDVGGLLGTKLTESELDDYDCDLKLIYVESGGSEGLFLERIDELREPYYFLTNGSNNSLAASLEILTYLNLHGKKGEVIHGDLPYVAGRIKALALAGKVTKALAETKFGVIGKPSDWLIASVPSYEKASEKLGVSFEDVPLDEVKSEFARLHTASPSMLPEEFPLAERVKAIKVYEALSSVCKKRGLDGFTVRCFDLLGPLATTGCIGLALLNDLGVTAACEGDVAALISMHIARIVTGQSSFQANPSRINVADNSIVFAHCTIPLGMTESYRLDTHFESGTGIAVKGYLREEDVTVLRISADLEHFFVSDGRIIQNLDESSLCRTQIRVSLEKDVSELLRNPCGNHHIIIYGRHADELETLLGSIL